MKITAFDPDYSIKLASGDVFIGGSTGSNSAFTGGDVTGSQGDLSVIGLRQVVSLASNMGDNTLGTVLTTIQSSPWLAAFAVPSNTGGGSFGSNAMSVGATNSGGVATDASRSDHRHLGLHSITSSSSNTLQRPTVNFRAGTNVALAASDTDGDGTFDTITISATASGGGGIAGSVASSALDGSGGGDFSTASATFVDLTGASITLTTGARRVKVGFVGTFANNNNTSVMSVTVSVDGTDQGGTQGYWRYQTPIANSNFPLVFTWMTPSALSAASHTFKIRVNTSAGTMIVRNNSSGAMWNFWVEESPT